MMIRNFLILCVYLIFLGALVSTPAQAQFDRFLPDYQTPNEPEAPSPERRVRLRPPGADDPVIPFPGMNRGEQRVSMSEILAPHLGDKPVSEEEERLSLLVARAFERVRDHVPHVWGAREQLGGYHIFLTDPQTNPRDMWLQGEVDEMTWQFHIPEARVVDQAQLNLTYVNSGDIFADNSYLTVTLNDRVLAQLNLDAIAGPRRLSVDVPPLGFFRQGRNELKFHVRQHHRLLCSVDSTYQLWTEINPAETGVFIKFKERDDTFLLKNMNQLLGSSLLASNPLTIILSEGADKDELVEWGTYVAQGYGLRNAGQLPFIQVNRAEEMSQVNPISNDFPGLDKSVVGQKNILVGTVRELEPFIDRNIYNQITGPFIGIYPLRAGKEDFVIVISGKNDRQVREATGYFSDPGWDFPAKQYMRFGKGLAKVPMPRLEHGYLYQNISYGFADIGLTDISHSGLRRVFGGWFALPPNFLPNPKRAADLYLTAEWTKQMGNGALINIALNDEVAQTISLREFKEFKFDDIGIKIPLDKFQPGLNKIELELMLPPSPGEDCLSFVHDKPRFDLSADSRLVFPPYGRLAVLPNLHLTSSAAYPYYIENPEADPVDLLVPALDSKTLAAAWMWAARLAQTAGNTINIHGFANRNDFSTRSTMIVGTIEDLKQDMLKFAPIPYEQLQTAWDSAAQRRMEGLLKNNDTPDQLATAAQQDGAWASLEVPTPGWLEQASALVSPTLTGGENILYQNIELDGVLMQFQSPQSPRRTWTVLTAPDHSTLTASTLRLMHPDFWNQADGDAIAWGESPDSLLYRKPLESYHLLPPDMSIKDFYLLIISLASINTLKWASIVLGSLCFFALLTWLVLRRTGQKGDISD